MIWVAASIWFDLCATSPKLADLFPSRFVDLDAFTFGIMKIQSMMAVATMIPKINQWRVRMVKGGCFPSVAYRAQTWVTW